MQVGRVSLRYGEGAASNSEGNIGIIYYCTIFMIRFENTFATAILIIIFTTILLIIIIILVLIFITTILLLR
jgi:hypothetical protein